VQVKVRRKEGVEAEDGGGKGTAGGREQGDQKVLFLKSPIETKEKGRSGPVIPEVARDVGFKDARMERKRARGIKNVRKVLGTFISA